VARERSECVRALALVAPLFVFFATLFIWPVWMMISAAVQDDTVSRALPYTASAMASWDGNGVPPETVRAALVRDLRASDDQEVFGNAVRRLNSDFSGFRTLLSRSRAASRDAAPDAVVDLATVDQRWGEARPWGVIKAAMPPYTDKNLLAAIDLKRDASGSIVSEAPGASANRVIMFRTLLVAGMVTLLCAAIGLPYAILAASVTGWKRTVLLLAVLLPLWTSLLVRTAAWLVLLQNEGLINKALIALGLTSAPLPLIFNRTGVLIAMTHVLLPFMVLPIYSVVAAIPKNLMPAAASMGASPLRAFWRVLLPLSMPGVYSGSLLVFMVATGYYITPALIGGADDQMISSVIAFYATGTANWGMAGALGLVLLLTTLLLYAVYGRLSQSKPVLGA
jgi:putative spermidine/putrescine transport system permease protein